MYTYTWYPARCMPALEMLCDKLHDNAPKTKAATLLLIDV